MTNHSAACYKWSC